MPEISLHFSLKYQNLSYQIRREENFEFHTISLYITSQLFSCRTSLYRLANSCPAIDTLIERVVLHPLQQASGIIINIIIDFLGRTIFGRPGPILAANVGPGGQTKIGPAGPLLDLVSRRDYFGPRSKFSLQANYGKDIIVCMCLGHHTICMWTTPDSEPDGLTFVAWRL